MKDNENLAVELEQITKEESELIQRMSEITARKNEINQEIDFNTNGDFLKDKWFYCKDISDVTGIPILFHSFASTDKTWAYQNKRFITGKSVTYDVVSFSGIAIIFNRDDLGTQLDTHIIRNTRFESKEHPKQLTELQLLVNKHKEISSESNIEIYSNYRGYTFIDKESIPHIINIWLSKRYKLPGYTTLMSAGKRLSLDIKFNVKVIIDNETFENNN